VLKDVLEEKLTHEYARREYGVAIDVEARKVLPGGVSAAPLVDDEIPEGGRHRPCRRRRGHRRLDRRS
jgi:hypothetical protein